MCIHKKQTKFHTTTNLLWIMDLKMWFRKFTPRRLAPPSPLLKDIVNCGDACDYTEEEKVHLCLIPTWQIPGSSFRFGVQHSMKLARDGNAGAKQ